jgi:hypothetical protein
MAEMQILQEQKSANVATTLIILIRAKPPRSNKKLLNNSI